MEEFWKGVLEANAHTISTAQMITRGLIVFFCGLIIIRFIGKRIFGKSTAFDIVLSIVIGSVLSRGITGNSPLIPTILTSFVLVGVHWILAFLTLKFSWIAFFLKGNEIKLVEDGKMIHDAMVNNAIGIHDLYEALRTKAKVNDLNEIKDAYLERDGEISFIRKQ